MHGNTELFSPEQGNRGDLNQGLGQLVLTLADAVRQLMERQAINRMEAGTLADEDVERLGQSLSLLEQRMMELRRLFELDDRDLDLRIETPDGKQLRLVELLDSLITRGVVLQGRAGISLAGVPLIELALNLALTPAR